MKVLLKYVFLSFLFLSCEDVIELDLPTTNSILIIDANINLFNSQTPQVVSGGVRLTRSTDFYDTEVPLVTNAQVSIKNLNTGYEFSLPYSGKNGWYTINDLAFFADPTAFYELKIVHENEVYIGVSEIHEVSPIDKLVQGNRTLFNGDEIEVEICFSDNAAKVNYYLYDLGFDQFQPIQDQFFQGSNFTFSNFYKPEDLSVGDTLVVKGFGISKQYFNYMELLLSQTGNSGGPFGNVAATARANITNTTNPSDFPLGYFIISQGVSKSIVIKDLN